MPNHHLSQEKHNNENWGVLVMLIKNKHDKFRQVPLIHITFLKVALKQLLHLV